MLLARWDLDSVLRLNDELAMLQLERKFAFENEKKLSGPNVKMPDLLRAGRHEFFDDADFRCLDEVPAIALRALRTAPCVMLGRLPADYLHVASSAPGMPKLPVATRAT
jgi:hypothetical protein